MALWADSLSNLSFVPIATAMTVLFVLAAVLTRQARIRTSLLQCFVLVPTLWTVWTSCALSGIAMRDVRQSPSILLVWSCAAGVVAALAASSWSICSRGLANAATLGWLLVASANAASLLDLVTAVSLILDTIFQGSLVL